MKRTIFAILLVAIGGCLRAQPTSLETSRCGISEQLGFWIWQRLAGNPIFDEVGGAKQNIFRIKLLTRDGRTLGGLQMRATTPARGALLVVQGNAWAVANLAQYMEPLRSAGYDVYMYDFRGYALSPGGTPRFGAIIEDYKLVFQDLLSTRNYKNIVIYGFSLGGAVAIDSLASSVGWRAMIIDSTPSRLSAYGCPVSLDPVQNLPADCSRLIVITGGRDRVVPTKKVQELITIVTKRGGEARLQEQWDHPFQEIPDSPNDERQRLLITLLNHYRG